MNIFQNPTVRLGIVITFIIGIVVVIAIILRTLIAPPGCQANFHRDYANRCVRDCPEGQDNDVTTGACVQACSEGIPYLNDDGSLECVQICGGTYCSLPGNKFGEKDTLCQDNICYDPSENSCFKSDGRASVCAPYMICGVNDTYQLTPGALKAGLTSTSELDEYGCYFNSKLLGSCPVDQQVTWNPPRTSNNPSINEELKKAYVCCDSHETALYIPDGPLKGKPICCLPGSTLTSNNECCSTSLCKNPESGENTCLPVGYVCTPEGGCSKDFATFNSEGEYTGCCYDEVGSDGVCNNLCTYPSNSMPKSCTSDSQCTPGPGESGGGVCVDGSCKLYCGIETSSNTKICLNDPNTATSICNSDASLCKLDQPVFTTPGGDSAIVQDGAGNDLYICGDKTGKQYWSSISGGETMTVTQGFKDQADCTQLQCLDHFATQGLLGASLDITTDSQGNKNLPRTSSVNVESGSCQAIINCAATGITLRDGATIDWSNQIPKTLNGDDDIAMKLHSTLSNGIRVYDGTFKGTGKCIPGTSELCKFLDTGEYSPYGTLDGIKPSPSNRKVMEGSGCAPASSTTSTPYQYGSVCMNTFSEVSGGVKITPLYMNKVGGGNCGVGGAIYGTTINSCECLANTTIVNGECVYNTTGSTGGVYAFSETLEDGTYSLVQNAQLNYLSLQNSLSDSPYTVNLQKTGTNLKDIGVCYSVNYSVAVVVMTYKDTTNNSTKYVGLKNVPGYKSPILSTVESNNPLNFYYWYGSGAISPPAGQYPLLKGFLRFMTPQKNTGAPEFWGTPIAVKDENGSIYALADPTWDTQTNWDTFQNRHIISIINKNDNWYLVAINCYAWGSGGTSCPANLSDNSGSPVCDTDVYYGIVDPVTGNFEFTNTDINLATPLGLKYVLSYKPGAKVNPDDKFTQLGVKALLNEITEFSSSVTFDFIEDYLTK